MDEDPVMAAVRARFEKSEMTLDALGEKMGYPPATARKSAWRFLNKTNDPRLSMLRKFAAAVECSVKSLFWAGASSMRRALWYLRFATSVISLTACVLLIALWVRSANCFDDMGWIASVQ